MEQNRFPLTGTVTEIGETKQFSAFFKKREFRMRFSDTDFTGKMVERIIKVSTINEHCDLLEMVRVNDVVNIQCYIEGKNYTKDNKTMNFTEIITYDIMVINSPSRATEEDKNAIVGKNGLEYQPKEASVEDLIRAGAYNKPEDDPLNNQQYRNAVGRIEDKKEPEGPDKIDDFGDLPF